MFLLNCKKIIYFQKQISKAFKTLTLKKFDFLSLQFFIWGWRPGDPKKHIAMSIHEKDDDF